MKKVLLLAVSCLMACSLLAGCGSGNTVNEANNQEVTNAADNQVNNQADNHADSTDTEQLKDPVLEWWQLYNPNGFDTITGVISNPNKVAIDVTYDLVYYKGGKEVHRNEMFSNFSISPEHEDVLWANVDIPKSEDVDDVKMENIIVGKAYYEPISAKYEFAEAIDGKAYFDFEFEKKPTVGTVWFLLYNDNNNNEKLDKGELIVTSLASTLEQKDRLYFDADVFPYTDYEVYYNAY